MARSSREPEGSTPNRFGTFGGVFTPSILTIFGVIMFMRSGFVVGQAGIGGALLILLFAKSITFLTALSVSAISTNTKVEGGGAYYLISRVLGPEFGGAIGLALFGGQALSVPFYILGFTEALVATFPDLAPHALPINGTVALVLFVLTWFGARYAIRIQYVILTLLGLAILSFLLGAATRFEAARFADNFRAAFTGGHSFWTIFAIYFPAVTGIMAGINMSGDLADPGRSIPRGTLLAVGVGALVYGIQILLEGGAYDRAALVERPFETLRDGAVLAGGALVVAGVFAATLSSAIGSLMGAPRVLQALARDRLIGALAPFARGARGSGEPRRALLLTGGITACVLLLAGRGAGGRGFFDVVASVVTMFFLFTYGTVNVAAFVESAAGNPSFRPRFRWFHWGSALAGALGCLGVAFLIHWPSALAAAALLALVYAVLSRSSLQFVFGDARRGLRFTQVRSGLASLAAMPVHPKNWRPTMLVLSGNPHRRLQLVDFATWLEGGRGIVTLAEVVIGDLEHPLDLRRAGLRRLESFIAEHELDAYPEVVVAESLDASLPILLQSQGIGPLKPNLVMLGWSAEPDRVVAFARTLRTVSRLGMSLVVYAGRELPDLTDEPHIDLWWRGRGNGSLMLLLAHLLRGNPAWRGARLRVLRVVPEDPGREPAEASLRGLIEGARIDAEATAVVSKRPFVEILAEYSGDATLVILGMALPDDGEEAAFHARLSAFLAPLRTVLLVHSSGDADLSA